MDPTPVPLPYAAPWTTTPGPEHLQQIAAAKARGSKINRAVRTATFSAWTLGIFGAITLATGFLSASGLFIGVGLCVVTYFEFQGATRLKKLDPRAPRLLAINQLALAAMLFLYGGYGIITSLHAPPALSELSDADLHALSMKRSDLQDMEKGIWVAVYVGVMFAGIVGPGLTAVYYNSRTKYIEAYARETPQWILDLQRAGMSL